MAEISEDNQALIRELLAAIMEGDLFTEKEAKALIRSVTAPSPEAIPDMLERVILWARDIRARQALLDVILTMDGNVQVTMEEGEEGPSMRLHPDLEIEVMPGELGAMGIERVFAKRKNDDDG